MSNSCTFDTSNYFFKFTNTYLLQEWFGTCIVKFATSLPVKSSSSGILVSGEVPPVSDASVQTLTSLAKDFEELAHTCLLVLHLEVRSCSIKTKNHIFYFKSCNKQISINIFQ